MTGRNVAAARAISRATPAPIVNLIVGIIMSVASSDRLGPIFSSSQSIFVCLIFMVILPVAPIIFEAHKGTVDLDVSRQDVRTRFFAYAIVFYLIAFSIYYLAAVEVMIYLSAAYISVTTGVMLANKLSKVSVHAAGIGGPGTALIIEYGLVATPVVLIWIMVIWSRTELKQHSLIQSIGGVIIASMITVFTYQLLPLIL